MNMTLQEAINRGYNLLASTVLALAGLAFGTVAFEEADQLDKVDDIGFAWWRKASRIKTDIESENGA